MIVYTDLSNDQQILSDSYAQHPLVFNGEEIAGITTVQSKMVEVGGESFDTGANASEEEAAEDDDGAEKVNNLVSKETGFGYEGPNDLKKAEFNLLFKKWVGEVKAKILENGGKPKEFMGSAKAFLAFVGSEFDNLEFYQHAGFVGLQIAWWDAEANTAGAPKFLYFTHGMVAEKY